MKVKDKVIVVTGGGSGIGRQLVLNLVGKGARVAAIDINEDTLKETVKMAGDNMAERISTHVVNISDRAAVEALPKKVIDKHGAVDGLINNAGIIQPFVVLNELGYDAIERVLNVNLWGVIYMTKTFLPHLLERPEAHIVNVSSMGGYLPVPGQTLYGASKAAVKLLTEGLNSELMETNVNVTVVFPGAIDTNITSNSGLDVPGGAEAESGDYKATSPVVAAENIVDGIENNKYRVLIGSDARMTDLMYRFNPKFAAKMIYNQMKNLLG